MEKQILIAKENEQWDRFLSDLLPIKLKAEAAKKQAEKEKSVQNKQGA